MKTVLLICLLGLLGCSVQAQTMPAKIYIVKNGTRTLGAFQFYTTLSADQAIKVKNNGYTMIETDADSIGVFKEAMYSDADYQSSIKKQKSTFIQLERGKSYYFKIGPGAHSQRLDIDEMTERAFKLYIGLNELTDNPTTYVFSKTGNLVRPNQ